MTRDELCEILEDMYPDDWKTMGLYDGYEDAFVGVSERHCRQPLVTYSRIKMLEIKTREQRESFSDNSEDDNRLGAEEDMNYNFDCAFLGDNQPIILNDTIIDF